MITYTRLYADPYGESHFEEIEIHLTMTEYAPPAPALELSSITPAKQFGFMQSPAGWSSDWHLSAVRNMFFVLSGEWEVKASDGLRWSDKLRLRLTIEPMRIELRAQTSPSDPRVDSQGRSSL